MHKLLIYKSCGSWFADVSRSEYGGDMIDALGTAIAPTSWTAAADAETVKAALEKSWPGHSVEVVEQSDPRLWQGR